MYARVKTRIFNKLSQPTNTFTKIKNKIICIDKNRTIIDYNLRGFYIHFFLFFKKALSISSKENLYHF